MKVFARSLMPGDLEHIAARLRDADRREVQAIRGPVPMYDTLALAVLRSTHYWVSVAGDEPIAMFGVAPTDLLSGIGSPWFLATDRAEGYPRSLVVEGRRYALRMLEVYPHLMNYVDARNTRSIRWLKHIGFEVHPAEPMGIAGLPFHPFEMKAQDDV